METARLVKEQQSDSNPNAQNQQQVFQQYVNLISKVAEQTPLVILLDDMHWADTSSTNLLFYLSRQINEKKIFVIATYRPDDAIAANKGEGHPIVQVKNEILRYGGKEYSLSYLGDNAIRELLGAVFPAYEVNDKFERWLRKISDGNSLFVTQFIKTLHEDGHLDNEGRFTGNYDDVKTPDSALAVVTERTRRLDAATRELLMYATAEGEEFTTYVLEQLSEKKPMQLLKELQLASQMGIINEKGHGRMFANKTTAIFGFSHALFHKALYDSLLDAQKRFLHRQCYDLLKAEWDRLTETKDRTSSLASKLLTHAEKCGEYEAAAEVALEAAKGAWQTFAEAEALEMLTHVLRLAEADAALSASIHIDALLLQADIHRLHGRYEGSLTAAVNALELSQRFHDELRAAISLINIGNVHGSRGAYEEALEYFQKSLVIQESIGNRAGFARALNNIGYVHYARGAYDEAIEYHQKSLTIQESIGNRVGIAMSLNNIGVVHVSRGAYEEALEYHQNSLAIWESIGNRKGIAVSLCNIGNVHNNRGAYDEALEYYRNSLAIDESIGDRADIAVALMNIGNVHRSCGAYDEALEYYRKSLAIQESIGDRTGIAGSLNNIGNVHGSRGAYDEALEYYQKSLVIQESIGNRAGIASSLGNIGVVYGSRGAYEEALEYHQKSLAIQESISNSAGIVVSLGNIGEIHRKQGNLQEARAALVKAKNIADAIRSKRTSANALCELGLLCEAEAMQNTGSAFNEKIDEAVLLLEEGLAILREIQSGDIIKYELELERIKKMTNIE
ncbi:MAG TPA: tetratricopeptide repeat protein, partial [Candidatus Kapabacteria bacterium]|nr:tetratricopeptide repeat protein [Candidatus Kapabacteria bacterium]